MNRFIAVFLSFMGLICSVSQATNNIDFLIREADGRVNLYPANSAIGNYDRSSQVYAHSGLNLPNMPYFMPYDPMDGARINHGITSFPLVMRLPALQLGGNLPQTLLQQLGRDGIANGNVTINVILQNLPFLADTRLCFRPHTAIDTIAPGRSDLVAYNREQNIRVGIFESGDRVRFVDRIINQVHDDAISLHTGDRNAYTVLSPDNLHTSGVAFNNPASLYTYTAYDANGARNAIICLHLLMSDGQHTAVTEGLRRDLNQNRFTPVALIASLTRIAQTTAWGQYQGLQRICNLIRNLNPLQIRAEAQVNNPISGGIDFLKQEADGRVYLYPASSVVGNFERSSQVYAHAGLALPNMPYFMPYDPMDGARINHGITSFPLVMRLPALQLGGNLPQTLLQQLGRDGIANGNVTINVILQNLPFLADTRLCFRPHTAIDTIAPGRSDLVAYNREQNIRVGIFESGDRVRFVDRIINQVHDDAISLHTGDRNAYTVLSPDNLHTSGVAFNNPASLYTYTAYDANGARNAIICLHLLMSDGQHTAVTEGLRRDLNQNRFTPVALIASLTRIAQTTAWGQYQGLQRICNLIRNLNPLQIRAEAQVNNPISGEFVQRPTQVRPSTSSSIVPRVITSEISAERRSLNQYFRNYSGRLEGWLAYILLQDQRNFEVILHGIIENTPQTYRERVIQALNSSPYIPYATMEFLRDILRAEPNGQMRVQYLHETLAHIPPAPRSVVLPQPQFQISPEPTVIGTPQLQPQPQAQPQPISGIRTQTGEGWSERENVMRNAGEVQAAYDFVNRRIPGNITFPQYEVAKAALLTYMTGHTSMREILRRLRPNSTILCRQINVDKLADAREILQYPYGLSYEPDDNWALFTKVWTLINTYANIENPSMTARDRNFLKDNLISQLAACKDYDDCDGDCIRHRNEHIVCAQGHKRRILTTLQGYYPEVQIDIVVPPAPQTYFERFIAEEAGRLNRGNNVDKAVAYFLTTGADEDNIAIYNQHLPAFKRMFVERVNAVYGAANIVDGGDANITDMKTRLRTLYNDYITRMCDGEIEVKEEWLVQRGEI